LVFWLSVLALGYAVYWGVGLAQQRYGAPDFTSTSTPTVLVKVETGDLAGDIAEELFAKGVIKSVKAFVLAANADPDSRNIQPGTYRLYARMPAKAALAMLLDPAANMVVTKVTIQEGLGIKATFSVLEKATGVPAAQFEEAAKDPLGLGIPDFWFNRDNSDGKRPIRSVEGFLFPDTYSFSPDATAAEMLKEMVSRFLDVAAELKFVDTAQAKRLMPFDALTVASLVEKEAGVVEDMPKIARVVYNRLRPSWLETGCGCLQFDSTTNYWREFNGLAAKPSSQLTAAELDDPKNPYNTVRLKGLPPGPIGSPGKAAMLAALNPAAGPWQYFVLIDKEGHSAFAVTLTEHQRNVAKARAAGVG
jgi:UPF0755 protein